MIATEELELTCIQCPMGCPLVVTMVGGQVVSVSGNTCPRGKAYGEQEATHPVRVVTSFVEVEDDIHPIPCKSSQPVLRERVADVLDAIRAARAKAPVALGEVLVADAGGTGVDVIATKARG